MKISSVPVGWEDQEEDLGCAFILDGDDGRRICGAARWSVSSYCSPHHVLCHVSYGSAAEADRMHEVEALAKVVGGRRSRDGVEPSRGFLRRLEQAARVCSRAKCS